MILSLYSSRRVICVLLVSIVFVCVFSPSVGNYVKILSHHAKIVSLSKKKEKWTNKKFDK